MKRWWCPSGDFDWMLDLLDRHPAPNQALRDLLASATDQRGLCGPKFLRGFRVNCDGSCCGFGPDMRADPVLSKRAARIQERDARYKDAWRRIVLFSAVALAGCCAPPPPDPTAVQIAEENLVSLSPSGKFSLETKCGDEAGPLCVNGHPAKRRPDVTYGGLPARSGFERDHRWPLCAGGPDTIENVWYQPWAEARVKDVEERRMCEAMCKGEVSPEEVHQYFRQHWGAP